MAELVTSKSKVRKDMFYGYEKGKQCAKNGEKVDCSFSLLENQEMRDAWIKGYEDFYKGINEPPYLP